MMVLTPEEIRRRRDRLRAAEAALRTARAAWGEVTQAAQSLVRRNAKITGRGNSRNDSFPGAVTLAGGYLRVAEDRYCGEGYDGRVTVPYGPSRPSYFRLPLEWLSMPGDEVTAAIRAEHERRKVLKEERERAHAAEAAAEEKARRRAQYEALQAEFGDGDGW